MKTVPARWFTKGRQLPPRVVVIHSMEAPEGPQTAENVAQYFATTDTKASAHICVDADSEVRCVADSDTAWAAPGANADGLQLELAGYARQSRKDWLDDYSLKMLGRAVKLVAAWCKKYDIPARRLTRAQLRAGGKGIVGHADVSAVYKRSDHTDPGSGFPWDWFVTAVKEELEGRKETTKTMSDFDPAKVKVPIGDHYGAYWKGAHYPLSFVLVAAATEAKFAKEAVSREAGLLASQLGRIEYALTELKNLLTEQKETP